MSDKNNNNNNGKYDGITTSYNGSLSFATLRKYN